MNAKELLDFELQEKIDKKFKITKEATSMKEIRKKKLKKETEEQLLEDNQ